MKHFDELGLPEALNHTLQHLQFTTPTPIQSEAIPPALKGRDILGSAQTGTGKTAAFGIPLAVHVLTQAEGSALVLTPTRELAAQVMTQLQALIGKRSKIKTALLIGGEAMPKQLQQLKLQPRIIVGTPGRVNDHLKRRSLTLHDTQFLVLDETDRMLDMGFTVQIETILKFMPAHRQTMLFSATLPQNIIKISQKYLTDPVRIDVGQSSPTKINIKHDVMQVSEGGKYDLLLTELERRAGSVILFMKTKYSTEKMARRLSKDGHTAEAIHGDLRQNKRDRAIAHFRSEKFRILVATDVAARGLDIPHVAHVINYDLPQCAEDYIHRIGRTARAGAEGEAMCLVTPADSGKWRAINKLMNPNAADDDRRKPRGQKSSDAPRGRKNGGGKSPRPHKTTAKGVAKDPGKGAPKGTAKGSTKGTAKGKFTKRSGPSHFDEPRRADHDSRGPRPERKARESKPTDAKSRDAKPVALKARRKNGRRKSPPKAA